MARDFIGATQVSMTDELANDPSAIITLQDGATDLQLSRLNPLSGYVIGKYEEAKLSRRSHEERWLRAFANFRGSPINTNVFIEGEISKAFIKITKTKVLAAYAQLCEVIFAQGQLPIQIVASPMPKGIPEYAHIDLEDPMEQPGAVDPNASQQPDQAIMGFHGDGNELKPGETITDRLIAWASSKFGKGVKLKEGPGDNPNRIILKPADIAALKMNKRIQDQLADCSATTTVRKSLFEKVCLGTGILKGPFSISKDYPSWDEDGKYNPNTEEMPILKHTSLWNFFPDPNGTLGDLAWAIERHKLSKSQLRALKKNRSFLPSNIDKVLEFAPNYNREYYETDIEENNIAQATDRYEALEFWGTIDKALVDQLGVDIGFTWPEGVDELPCNVWVVAGEFIRFVMNPFTPAMLPYYISPYEFNPYSVFGVGVCENMEDTQMLMNGFMRLAVDNAVLSGSVMLEVDESVMSPGQDYTVETAKIFRKNQTTQQAAVRPIQIPNTSQANMQMFDAARRLADEATGIPSFSHGMTGVQGTGRTAGGISMLMNAASLTAKTVVKNADDYWFEPVGKAYYHWNMQYKFDKELLGDLSVIAKGTDSFMQKEVKLQKLLQFAQIVLPNPNASAWVRWNSWTAKVAEVMEVDPEELLNRPDEAMLQMKLMQSMAANPAQGAVPPDNSGAQAGAPAMPGQQGFTGTPQQGAMNGQPNPNGPTGQEAGPGPV